MARETGFRVRCLLSPSQIDAVRYTHRLFLPHPPLGARHREPCLTLRERSIISAEMGQMAAIRRKLREAIFFFRHLYDETSPLKLETDDLDFFLSAFLSAGRSTIGFFDRMQGKHYRSWFHDWKMGLVDEDRKLLHHMVRQRNLEVHEAGADIIPQFELVPVIELETASRYEDPWSRPPRPPARPASKKKSYFWIDGEQLDVTSTCRRYLELLLKLVSDFEESLTARD